MTVIRLYETITEKTVQWIMPILNNVPNNSRVIFKINCKGGLRSTYVPILEKVKKLRYEQNCYLVAEGIRFYSASFLLYILCNERIIIPESVGMIHLPEFSKRDLIKEYEKMKMLEKEELKCAQFITTYTNFTIDDIFTYNLFPLYAKGLLKWKVADRAVSLFTY